jgi:hypothetical protein
MQERVHIHNQERNTPVQVHEVIVPVFFFVTVAAIWGGYILTRHKERMAMIQKGMEAEDIKSLYARAAWHISPLASLKWGMVLIGVGVAVLVGMWLRDAYMVGEGVYPGLIALLGGLGLIVFYFIARRKAE